MLTPTRSFTFSTRRCRSGQRDGIGKGVLPGDTRKTLWQRYLTIEELPQVLNPDCGYVFSVNNGPFC